MIPRNATPEEARKRRRESEQALVRMRQEQAARKSPIQLRIEYLEARVADHENRIAELEARLKAGAE